MARQVSDREDLFREATGLHRRIELADAKGTIVAGLRRDGAWNCYFGQDNVLGFNKEGDLRRLFRQGTLYRAETGGQLVKLARGVDGSRVVFETQCVSELEKEALLTEACLLLQSLRAKLLACESPLRGEPAADVPQIVAEISSRLHQVLAAPLRIASDMRR